MHKRSLRKSSYQAVSSYFAERPLLSEPDEETYRRSSQCIPRNNRGFIYFVTIGLFSGLAWIVTAQELGTLFTPTWFEHLFWVAFGSGALYVQFRDES